LRASGWRREKVLSMQHRVFIAISVPLEVREKILDYRGNFGSHLLKWQPQVNLHVTIAFLGRIDDEALEKTKGVIKSVAVKSNKFVQKFLKLARTQKKNPTMIWATGETTDELNEFTLRVRDALAEKRINFD